MKNKYKNYDIVMKYAKSIKEERQALGEWWFKQEYLCEFVETVDQVFSYDQVMAAITEEVEPLFGGVEGV